MSERAKLARRSGSLNRWLRRGWAFSAGEGGAEATDRGVGVRGRRGRERRREHLVAEQDLIHGKVEAGDHGEEPERRESNDQAGRRLQGPDRSRPGRLPHPRPQRRAREEDAERGEWIHPGSAGEDVRERRQSELPSGERGERHERRGDATRAGEPRGRGAGPRLDGWIRHSGPPGPEETWKSWRGGSPSQACGVRRAFFERPAPTGIGRAGGGLEPP